MHNMDLMTSKDKATELGISRATLTRRVQAGELIPAFRAEGVTGVMLFTPEPDPTASVSLEAAESVPPPAGAVSTPIPAPAGAP